MRSRSEMKLDSTLSSVVLPAPVPPLISMFSRARTQCSRNSSIGRVSDRIGDQVLGLQPLGRKTADREQRAVDRQRRNDRVDARAVRQARVDHRRAVVDAAADAADDAVDDAHQVLVVLERRRQPLELAAALDVDLLVGVDQDVADRRVAQQRLERPEAEDLVDDVAEDHLALGHAERHALFGDQVEQQRADLRLGARPLGRRERLEVQAVEQLAVDVGLQLEVLRPRRFRRAVAAGAAGGDGGFSERLMLGVFRLEKAEERAPLLRLGLRLVGMTPRSCRVKLSNCAAISELFVSVSGTPEFSAVDTVR